MLFEYWRYLRGSSPPSPSRGRSGIALAICAVVSLNAAPVWGGNTYDFEQLTPGNLNGQQGWKTALIRTSKDIQVDNTQALRSTVGGPGVMSRGHLRLGGDLVQPDFSDTSKLHIFEFDIINNWWGSSAWLSMDSNDDGLADSHGVGLGLNAVYGKIYFKGLTTTPAPGGWSKIRIVMDMAANNGQGSGCVLYKNPTTAASWTAISPFQNINMSFNSTATDAANPANWNTLFVDFQTDGGGLDNVALTDFSVSNAFSLSANSVAENSPVNTEVGAFQGADGDTYTLVTGTGDTDNASFTIVGSSLKTAAELDFETQPSLSIRVKASHPDYGNCTDVEQVITINVSDVADAANIALNKIAEQSSGGGGAGPNNAVDGNTNGNYFNSSVTHTYNEPEAWWQVDLDGVYDIETINVYNRTDCCSERLSNFYVMVSNTPFPAALDSAKSQANWSQHFAGRAGRQESFAVGAQGRYVRVQLVGSNYLSLAEVEVMGLTAIETDTDGDGVTNDVDNCPTIANQGQEDTDGDGIGDVCEADTDGDGIIDDNDNCTNDTNQVAPNCQDAQIDKQMISKLITGCKADPENGDHRWICDEPTLQEKTEVKKATEAVFQAVCRDDTVPEPNDVCLATQIYSFSWGGLLEELIDSDNSDNCPDVANLVVPDCQAALDDKQTVLKLIRGCKADPENDDHRWICDEPTLQKKTEIKNATRRVFDAVCRNDTVPEPNDVCLASQIDSFSWGGQLVQ